MSTTVDYQEHRVDAFPTRIFRRKFAGLEALNKKLAKIVLQHEESDGEGLQRSNAGGWHSKNDFFDWKEPEVQVVLNLMQAAVVDYAAVEAERDPKTLEVAAALEAWANVSRQGNYNKPHVHPSSNFSLVYYADVGDYEATGPDDPAGSLELLDPRNRVAMVASPGIDARDALRMRPESGLLLVFPSWMYHYVHPYQGERPRISIACNAIIKNMKVKKPTEATARPPAVIVEED